MMKEKTVLHEMVSRSDFQKAIDELSDSNSFSVSALAEKLSVSRGWIYENFPEVKGIGRKPVSEDQVIAVLEEMRSEGPSRRITVSEVSSRLGITRQTFGSRFKHLYGFLAPEANFFKQSSAEQVLLQKVSDLEKKVDKQASELEVALRDKEDKIFSTLMRQDAESFETIKTSSSLKRMQDLADEYAETARGNAKEAATLRFENVRLKGDLEKGGCEIVGHLKPDYSAVLRGGNVPMRELLSFYNAAEERNLNSAEEFIREQNPDYVIYFQPFFSCNRSSIPALPVSGKVVLVESNVYREDVRSDFVRSLNGFSVIAIFAKSSLDRTKLWAHGQKVPFSDEFISSVHSNIMPPLLEDGFSAVLGYDPKWFAQ